MLERIFKILPWVGGFLLFLNLLLLDFIWVSWQKREPKITETVGNTFEVMPTLSPDCLACKVLIEEEISKAISVIPTQIPVAAVTPKPTPTKTPVPNIIYLSIGSSGETSNTSWTDIPGTEFYFNLADYPKVKAVRWEVNLRSFLAGNPVWARIYDVTNSRAVDGSELSTTSGTSLILRSSDLTIWQGNNLYRVQAKSSSGNPAYLDAPRLKIILE